MFCEKCGNQINDNDKFCTKCGSPVSVPVQSQPPVQPKPQQVTPQPPVQATPQPTAPQAPVQQAPQPTAPQAPVHQAPQPTTPQAPVQQAPQPTAPQASVQQAPQPTAPQAPVKPAAPKKGLPKGAKLAIIFSSIGVAVVALLLVLVFAVFIPLLTPKVNISDYIVMSLDSDEAVVDGKISGEIGIDKSALGEEYADKLSKNILAESAFSELLYDVKISYTVKGDEDRSDYSYSYVDFENAKQDDVFVVTVTWPDDSYSLSGISQKEKEAGIKFDKATKTIELKVADVISENGVEVKTPVELDLLGYINDNNLIVVKPSSYNKNQINVFLDEFEGELGDYKLEHDSYYDSYVNVYDKDDNYLASVYVEFSDDMYLKDGDKITLDYSSYNSEADKAGFVLKGDKIDYTVKAPELVTATSAKTNVQLIKDYFTENAGEFDSSIKDGDALEVNEVYFITQKSDSDYGKIVIVFNNKTQKYYKTVELSADGWFTDGKFVFDGYSYENASATKLDDAKAACYYLDKDSKSYVATKIG